MKRKSFRKKKKNSQKTQNVKLKRKIGQREPIEKERIQVMHRFRKGTGLMR